MHCHEGMAKFKQEQGCLSPQYYSKPTLASVQEFQDDCSNQCSTPKTDHTRPVSKAPRKSQNPLSDFALSYIGDGINSISEHPSLLILI